MIFDDGTHRVELRYVGVGHTHGDGFAWLPIEAGFSAPTGAAGSARQRRSSAGDEVPFLVASAGSPNENSADPDAIATYCRPSML